MLWGAHAQKKRRLITGTNHLTLEAPHPSPLSAYRGYFGCGHFGKANGFIATKKINW
jgi:uracil-DNA glycosylase